MHIIRIHLADSLSEHACPADTQLPGEVATSIPEPPLLPPSRDPCSCGVTSPTANTVSSFPPLNSLETELTLLRLLSVSLVRSSLLPCGDVWGRVRMCADAETTALVGSGRCCLARFQRGPFKIETKQLFPFVKLPG